MMKKVKSVLIISIITFILLELGIMVLVKLNLVKIDTPSYDLSNSRGFWQDISEDWGVWHPSDASIRHKKDCFDVVYKTNHYGARDKERSKKSKVSRTVVIGDSFVEGFGVDAEDRFTNIMEEQLGRPVLNFGTSGNFGMTQAYLIYKHLVKDFDHDELIISFLPSNDFIEDDYDFGVKSYQHRYRPYWIGEDSFKLVYVQDHISKSLAYNIQENKWKNLLKNFTYTYNLIGYFKLAMQQGKKQKEANASNEKKLSQSTEAKVVNSEMPNYYNFTERHLNVLKHNLTLIAEEAKGKKITLLTIPSAQEVTKRGMVEKDVLDSVLVDFTDSLGIQYVNLINEWKDRKDQWGNYYLPCDGHFSLKGNLEAAKALIKNRK